MRCGGGGSILCLPQLRIYFMGMEVFSKSSGTPRAGELGEFGRTSSRSVVPCM
jgi:hypothetical protein